MKNHSKLLAAALFLLSGAPAVAEMYHREATAADDMEHRWRPNP
jgi:hypothetical protein